MKGLLKAAALGLVLAWSMTPFEAKAAAVSLLTGRPMAVSTVFDDDDSIGRAQIAGHRRPARMARTAAPAPDLTVVRRDRGVPLPAFRRSYARPAVLLARALEGHALDLGRERAPPA